VTRKTGHSRGNRRDKRRPGCPFNRSQTVAKAGSAEGARDWKVCSEQPTFCLERDSMSHSLGNMYANANRAIAEDKCSPSS
jgi:hypothetical protein